MQKVSVLLIVLLYFITTNCTSLFAQTSIKGKVIDLQDAPISFANVLLLQAADSSLIKGEVTSELGTYEIETTQIGSFIISTTMIGFGVIYSQPFDIQSVGEQIQMDVIRLAEESITLTGVDVVAKKPLYEQQIDRLVVNVQNSITSSGATALEVLERSPGVAVNRQNSALSMAGKQGVVVMINGKINRTPVAAVVQLLEGMSADNIEKIELITTPPANYEAEGDAGFINIILKKTSDRGLNGAFTLSAGVGNGNTSAASTNFNFRKNKFNLFGDYSYSRKEQKQLFKNYRKIVLDENTVENSTVSARDPIQLNHNARLGLDYQLSEKTVAGVLISAYNNKWSMNAVNTVDVLVNQSLDTLITLDNIELNQWKHWGGNFNLQHNFTDASQLNFDVDYLRYDNENPTDYFNTYRDATGNILFEQVTRSGKSTPVTIAVGKLDYSKKINDKFKIESGLKGTVSRFENDVNVAELVSDVWVNDPNFTAIFNLEEDITAAYVSLDAQLNAKTSGKLGLRYEHTRSNLGSATMPNIVDRNYGNFFPTVFVSRTLSDDSNLNFSYSRRITRPTFNDMAPFVIFIDPNTFYSGNAALQPALSNTVKVDYRLKTVMMSVSYSKDDDAIARFQPRLDPETNQTVIGSANLNFRETFAGFVNFPLKVNSWWSMRLNIGGRWQKTNANFDETVLEFEQANWSMNGQQTFTLPSNFSAEFSGFYNSKQLIGTAFAQPIWGVNFGLQKVLPNNQGRLRFGIDDIFESIRWRGATEIPEQNLINRADYDFSNRTFKISYSRNFGNEKLKSYRKRQTGAEAERQRVN